MKPSTHTSTEVLNITTAEGVPKHRVFLLDTAYVLLDDYKAADYFRDLAFKVQSLLSHWAEDFSDCDKYSRILQSLAALTHAEQWAKIPGVKPAGLAIGVFNYIQDSDRKGHSINVLLTKKRDKDSFCLRFFEPQTGEEVSLSAREITSTTMLLL